MSKDFVVIGKAGTGSVAVEAALTLLGLPYRAEEHAWGGAAEGVLGTPAGQVPTLFPPGGEVMTESAAILTWLADAHPGAGLSPPADSPRRPAFLRWMAFVSASIYAHYWVLDAPERLTDDPAAQAQIRERLAARIAHGWAVMEAGIAPGDYLLGDALTVLDLYVVVVSRWTPRRALHQSIAPHIGQVVRRVESDPRLSGLWAARFPLSADSEEA